MTIDNGRVTYAKAQLEQWCIHNNVRGESRDALHNVVKEYVSALLRDTDEIHRDGNLEPTPIRSNNGKDNDRS